jgi:hypothetical protein
MTSLIKGRQDSMTFSICALDIGNGFIFLVPINAVVVLLFF